ncbi:NADPH-dependent F420 reductase [Streptomyces sp. VRA16 Mangrove soil]|uniref:NADPH-dependent F420 reductase n=1 Tax=Streptomyces sp. VRA16 Mangrove soil TaxID=2817434 RepID=UPI001A9E880F|nr:NADPH-dependent F420 reductase [Streptomyces sp. VRA16 Mangrove soil]MBO1330282.1 NADPH-dependent F420 reductase [Streptomyces sp. VRA16 Mangrove soil]
MKITMIGAGSMAHGIATRALVGGSAVRLINRNAAKATELAAQLVRAVPGADVRSGLTEDIADADVVVLALPFEAAKEVAATHRAALAGKVVVDISNPVDFTTFDALTVAPGTSAAEEIAAVAPEAHVVKAFNTIFAGTLIAGELATGTPLDLFVAGDDQQAKHQVLELGRTGGLHAVDAGPLRRARELESFQFLHMTLQESLGAGWMSGIKIVLP